MKIALVAAITNINTFERKWKYKHKEIHNPSNSQTQPTKHTNTQRTHSLYNHRKTSRLLPQQMVYNTTLKLRITQAGSANTSKEPIKGREGYKS